jgi:hypothetical protein
VCEVIKLTKMTENDVFLDLGSGKEEHRFFYFPPPLGSWWRVYFLHPTYTELYVHALFWQCS